MKSKLPFKTTLRLAMQGKTVTKIMTVFLCAFSFALFALASTGYLYNKKDYYARALLHLAENSGVTTFSSNLGDTLWQRNIERIENATGWDFAYYYRWRGTEDIFGAELNHFQYDYVFYEEELTAKEQRLPEYQDIRSEGAPSPLVIGASLGEALGYQVLAGRYPESVYEIAIPVVMYEDFLRNGYTDNSANYFYFEDGCFSDGTPYYDYETGSYAVSLPSGKMPPYLEDDYTGYAYLPLGNQGERWEIETYEDILGKEVVLWGDLLSGVLDKSGIYRAKIVGVMDTSAAAEIPTDGPIFSEAWREIFFAGHDNDCEEMYAAPVATKAQAKAAVDVTLEILQYYNGQHPGEDIKIGAEPVCSLARQTSELNNERLFFAVFGSAGLLFGVFSALLCWHLTTSSLNLKKRKIGVLRAMGAGENDVKHIVLCETLLIACCVFGAALAISAGAYYGLIQGWSYVPRYGVSLFNFTGWNVLLLALFSFAVPLLCSIVPLRKFLKKSIVDNISGNIKAR